MSADPKGSRTAPLPVTRRCADCACVLTPADFCYCRDCAPSYINALEPPREPPVPPQRRFFADNPPRKLASGVMVRNVPEFLRDVEGIDWEA